MAIGKKRRKRKRHYKTGIYNSPKCKTPIKYRSGWELEVAKYLDFDVNVIEYGYECVAIEYVANIRTGKVRSYYPDFLISYKDGLVKLVEVKRKDKLNDPKVLKKAEAAEKWCEKKGIKYEFWTNTMIEAYKKINEVNSSKTIVKATKKKKVLPKK
jgi:hypothetical protein